MTPPQGRAEHIVDEQQKEGDSRHGPLRLNLRVYPAEKVAVRAARRSWNCVALNRQQVGRGASEELGVEQSAGGDDLCVGVWVCV